MRLRATNASAESWPPLPSAAFWGAGVGSGESDRCRAAAASFKPAATPVAWRQASAWLVVCELQDLGLARG